MQRDPYGFYRHYHGAYGDYLCFDAVPGFHFYSLELPTPITPTLSPPGRGSRTPDA
jgi:hypothetical protein